jgi:hypothetical protein
MAPVPQESEIIELNLEQLEKIQGGRFFKKIKKIAKNIVNKLGGSVRIPVYSAGQPQYDDKYNRRF